MIDMCFAFLKTKENCQLMKFVATQKSCYAHMHVQVTETQDQQAKESSINGKMKMMKNGIMEQLQPETKDWYNIKYDGEEEVLSLNILMDIEKGDLEFLD